MHGNVEEWCLDFWNETYFEVRKGFYLKLLCVRDFNLRILNSDLSGLDLFIGSHIGKIVILGLSIYLIHKFMLKLLIYHI